MKIIKITLVKTISLDRRIDTLKLLYQKAEEKVFHADTFRQRNLNFALVIFAGLIAAGVKKESIIAPYLLSSVLTIIMFIFTFWDRKWHRTKHGWEGTSKICYSKIVDLINNPKINVDLDSYDEDAENNAEFFSWQPIVFYFLFLASLASYFVFK
jgi:hypothetical protein